MHAAGSTTHNITKIFFILLFMFSLVSILSNAKEQSIASDSSDIESTGFNQQLLDTDFFNTCQDCDKGGHSLYLPRPIQLNGAALYNPFYYLSARLPDHSFTFGYRFSQTRESKRIAECLFGRDILTFRGSQVPGKRTTDFVADYFGLSPRFLKTIHLKPVITNHTIDWSLLLQLGHWAPCFENTYFGISTCLTHSSWQLASTERKPFNTSLSEQEIPVSGPQNFHFPACAMATTTVPALSDLDTALAGDFLFGDMTSTRHFGNIFLNKSQTTTQLATINLTLGHNFLLCDDYHAGLFIALGAPTGNRPDARIIFEPIVGNGRHWEIGGGLDMHYNIWHCYDYTLGVYVYGSVAHLFKDSQWRTFDFKESSEGIPGLASRYILLKEFARSTQYTGRLIPAANFTTRHVKTAFDVQGEAVIRLLLTNNCWAWGMGYNVYGRSKEKIFGLCSSDNQSTSTRLGIKGIAGVCAQEWVKNSGLTGTQKTVVATESNSRLLTSKNLLDLIDNPIEVTSEKSDTFFLAWESPTDPQTPISKLIIAEDSQVNNNPAPVLVSDNNINLRGVPSQLSHTFFCHGDYRWDVSCYEPFIGIGGEIEWAQDADCRVCTANQWSVWIHGGVMY